MKKNVFLFSVAALCSVHAASTLSLDGEWRLDYFPQPDDGAVRELPLAVPFKTVKAEVPGNCELDLVNAGVLPPPELGMNVLKLRPYEGYQWLYAKTFAKPEVAAGQRAMLRFEGVDTLADIFLNGKKIGETSNMLMSCCWSSVLALRMTAASIIFDAFIPVFLRHTSERYLGVMPNSAA